VPNLAGIITSINSVASSFAAMGTTPSAVSPAIAFAGVSL
jgi:hypothetical protein